MFNSVSNTDLYAINDFYFYLQENNWEKLRSFRYESKLQSRINLLASRYLLKKYDKDLKENARKGTQIDGFPSFRSCFNCYRRLTVESDGEVTVLDIDGGQAKSWTVPVAQFMDAWEDSGNYMVIVKNKIKNTNS